MKSVKVKIETIDGVKRFVKISQNQSCNLDLVSGRFIIDAKSIMGIFSLDLTKPIELRAHEDGEAADAVLGNFAEFAV